jgi:hypothetical protein
MRVRPTWKVPTAKQAANFTSDFGRPSFGTLRRPVPVRGVTQPTWIGSVRARLLEFK